MNTPLVQLHTPAYMAGLRLTAKYLRDYTKLEMHEKK